MIIHRSLAAGVGLAALATSAFAQSSTPTAEEIAAEMDVPLDTVRGMMDASQHAVALERPVGDDGDTEFGDSGRQIGQSSPAHWKACRRAGSYWGWHRHRRCSLCTATTAPAANQQTH